MCRQFFQLHMVSTEMCGTESVQFIIFDIVVSTLMQCCGKHVCLEIHYFEGYLAGPFDCHARLTTTFENVLRSRDL
jgi:hypothetical protein